MLNDLKAHTLLFSVTSRNKEKGRGFGFEYVIRDQINEMCEAIGIELIDSIKTRNFQILKIILNLSYYPRVICKVKVRADKEKFQELCEGIEQIGYVKMYYPRRKT